MNEVIVWAAAATLVYYWVGPAGAVGVVGLAVVMALAGFRIVGWFRS